MKNKYIIFFILLSFVVVTGIITYLTNKNIKYSPFILDFKFEMPVCVGIDNNKNIYFIDSKYKRLSKINYNEGKLEYSIKATATNKKEDAYFDEIAVDNNGNVYTQKIVYHIETEMVTYEEIIKINSEGKIEKVLYTLKHENDKEIFDSKFFALQIKNNYLYFDVRYEDRIEFYRISIAGKGEPHKIFEIPASKNQYYFLSGIEPGKVYISSYSGDKLYKYTENKEIIHLKDLPDDLLIDKMIMTQNDELLFTDLFNQCIFKKDNKEVLSMYLTKNNFKDLKNNKFIFDKVLFKDLWINDNNILAVIEQANNIIILIDKNKNIDKIFEKGNFKIIDKIFKFFTFLSFIAFIILFFYTIYYFLFKILPFIPIILKLIALFVPIIIITLILIFNFIFNKLYERYLEETFNRIGAISQIGEKIISKDLIDKINKPKDYRSNEYNKLQKELETLLNEKKDRWNQSVYAKIYKYYNNMFYVIADNEGSYGVLYPHIHAPPQYYESYIKNEFKLVKYKDPEGTYMEAVTPLKNSKGLTIGLLIIGLSHDEFQKLHHIFINDLIRSIIITVIVFILIITWISIFILFTINKLHNAVTKIASGDWNVQVKIKSKDEIEELGKGFNLMCKYIKEYIEEINKLNSYYFKFVPKEFLIFLNKNNITEVQLGNQIETNISILFSDIRSFTTISETLSPQENFNFINYYLKYISPIIRKNRGFIDKYIGDAIMALFRESVNSSLDAAIEMQKELSLFNTENLKKDFLPIKIGCGIHYGKVILGILGEEERMQSTVISDAVNTASRLEALTKKYGSQIIISEDVINNLLNIDKYLYRYIDNIILKGKTKRIKIYEVLNSEDPESIELKINTKEDFENAINLYYENRFEESLNIFKTIYSKNQKDKACEYFIKMIENKDNLNLIEENYYNKFE